MAKFVYDKKHLRFNRQKIGFWRVLLIIVKWLFISIVVAVIYYMIFALIFNTNKEKRLASENRVLESEYTELSRKMDMVESAVENLQLRDREIYHNIFKSDLPDFTLFDTDSVRFDLEDLLTSNEPDLIWDAYADIRRMDFTVSQVEGWLATVLEGIESGRIKPGSIPSIIPVKNFSSVQIGASIGEKINPFLKTLRQHNGLDIMAGSGTEVICAADGTVSEVLNEKRGLGNQVVVTHANGFTTRYAHLGDVFVRAGQSVKQGSLIGRVGSSGVTFGPCLHYEVVRDGEYQDPVNYFFSDVPPSKYKELLLIAMTTGQSMD